MWNTVQLQLASPWVQAALIAVLGMLIVWLLAKLVHLRLSRSGSSHWALVARKIIAYGGAIMVLLLAAQAAGLDLTALVATAGVAGIAIGFAAQTSLGNLIAGLFLLFDRPFEVGDTVEMEGRLGVVQGITLMSTLVRTFDGIQIRWPNDVVLKSTIVNFSRYPARRVEVPVGIAYGSDVAAARAAIVRELIELDIVLLEPAPEALTVGFLDSAVQLNVRAWVSGGEFVKGRTAVIESVHSSLAAAGVTIPFPQVTVWRGDDEPCKPDLP